MESVKIDLKTLEKCMKLCKKHGLTEMTLPDGTKLCFPPREVIVKPVARSKTAAPVNTSLEGVDVRFAAVLPKPQNEFQRFGVSRLLSQVEKEQS